MSKQGNMVCAACDVVFDSDSEIVYCPECGAPHHKACWKETGHCACEALHNEGYTWTQQSQRADSANTEESNEDSQKKMITCPVCGGQTPDDEEYCEKCGYSLAHSRNGAYGGAVSQIDMDSIFGVTDGELIEGVPAGDIKKFVGNMAIYYLPRFSLMSKAKRKISFNFTAGITHGLWFISRKMYGIGALLLSIITLCSVYQMYFFRCFEKVIGTETDTAKAAALIMQEHPWIGAGMMLYYAVLFLQYGIMLWCALYGNRYYMKHAVKKIKKINAAAAAEHNTPEQFNEKLEQSGGIAWLPMLSTGFCYLLILYALNTGLIF